MASHAVGLAHESLQTALRMLPPPPRKPPRAGHPLQLLRPPSLARRRSRLLQHLSRRAASRPRRLQQQVQAQLAPHHLLQHRLLQQQ